MQALAWVDPEGAGTSDRLKISDFEVRILQSEFSFVLRSESRPVSGQTGSDLAVKIAALADHLRSVTDQFNIALTASFPKSGLLFRK